jgi:hypothetical protein
MLPLEAATDASDSSDTTAATAVSGSGGGGSVDNEAGSPPAAGSGVDDFDSVLTCVRGVCVRGVCALE